ncbi:MAG: hypothetical protein IKP47_07610 [Ruminococcus sp.]|nr:hypothetical protein [Ruminococcus sp.]
MSKKEKSRGNILGSVNAVNIIVIIIVAAISIGVIVLLAKSLFASNSKDVPEGIYTGTVTNHSATSYTSSMPLAPETSASEQTTSSVTETAPPETSSTTAAASEQMYITNYVQLKASGDQKAENLICMSPNIRVKVYERLESGYVKVGFHNSDGNDYVGYVLASFLSPEPVQRDTTTTTAAAAAAAEAPAQ